MCVVYLLLGLFSESIRKRELFQINEVRSKIGIASIDEKMRKYHLRIVQSCLEESN